MIESQFVWGRKDDHYSDSEKPEQESLRTRQ